MPRIYRSMKKDGDRPLVGNGATALGVRFEPDPNADIVTDGAGKVNPDSGGMSVAPSLESLPTHRVPKRLRDRVEGAIGSNKCFVWRYGAGAFANEAVAEKLKLHVTDPTHGVVTPSETMPAEEYTDAIARTRDAWEIDED